MESIYFCIDLKSFYASVECVERGLDPMTTKLVVADPSRGKGAICLAITPALKNLGIKNRCRIFEIPKNLDYLVALPQMRKYMEVSAQIYKIYLRYLSSSDIHVYSIDECFLDVTKYLKLYKKTPQELAKMLLQTIYQEVGLYATCGIGTNLFLAKVALDVTAKHAPDFIGYLDNAIFKKEIWHHEPITDIWNISAGIAGRLKKYHAYNLYDVTQIDEKKLYLEFGVNAEILIDHAWGEESCTIDDIHAYKTKSNSLSNSQILFSDYNSEDAFLVLKEMVDLNCLELVDRGLVTNNISLGIGYSKDVIKPAHKSMKLDCYTSSFKELMKYFKQLYWLIVDDEYPIRRISVGFSVVSEDHETFDLFTNLKQQEKEKALQHTIIDLKKRFGKNSILKAMNLEEKATARKRNTLIGGHNATREEQNDKA